MATIKRILLGPSFGIPISQEQVLDQAMVFGFGTFLQSLIILHWIRSTSLYRTPRGNQLQVAALGVGLLLALISILNFVVDLAGLIMVCTILVYHLLVIGFVFVVYNQE